MIISFLVTSTQALAGHWLETSPAAFFDENDWAMFRSTIREHLDNGEDGTSKTWKNSESGNNGTITVINSYKENGTTCRKTVIENHVESRQLSGKGVYRLCKQPDGKWKVVP